MLRAQGAYRSGRISTRSNGASAQGVSVAGGEARAERQGAAGGKPARQLDLGADACDVDEAAGHCTDNGVLAGMTVT